MNKSVKKNDMQTAAEKYTFSASIQATDGGGAFVEVPMDVERTFGKKRVKIQAEFEGIPYRGSLVRMGTECHLLLIKKEIREKLGKQAGDSITVTLWEDTEPRIVAVPDDVAQMLQEENLAEGFQKLSFTHQREYIQWVTDAKKAETRTNRIVKMSEMLKAGKKEPK